jgi:hypothetical protein
MKKRGMAALLKFRIISILIISAVCVSTVSALAYASTGNTGGEAAIVEFFDALVAVGVKTMNNTAPAEKNNLFVFRFGEIMWIFQDSTGTRAGVWKNAPIITQDGEKKFADIEITGNKVTGYDGYSLNRQYLEYLLSIDGITIETGTKEEKKAESAPAAVSLQVDQKKAVAETHTVAAAAAAEDKVTYTSVIVDASGLGAGRVLRPNIVTPDGKVVHGYDKLAMSDVESVDVIRYCDSMEQAKGQKIFIGNNPLIIKAVGATGSFKGNIVISPEDAEKIRNADKNGKFLKSNRVSVVL